MEDGSVASQIEHITGSQELKALQGNMDPADPMTIHDGVMSSSSNHAHLGDEEEGMILIDLNRGILLHRGGAVKAFAEDSASVAIPKHIEEHLKMWPRTSVDSALANFGHASIDSREAHCRPR